MAVANLMLGTASGQAPRLNRMDGMASGARAPAPWPQSPLQTVVACRAKVEEELTAPIGRASIRCSPADIISVNAAHARDFHLLSARSSSSSARCLHRQHRACEVIDENALVRLIHRAKSRAQARRVSATSRP